jgi:hypothetical protein
MGQNSEGWVAEENLNLKKSTLHSQKRVRSCLLEDPTFTAVITKNSDLTMSQS